MGKTKILFIKKTGRETYVAVMGVGLNRAGAAAWIE